MESGRAGADAPKIFGRYAASSQHGLTGGTSHGSSSLPSSRSAASAPNAIRRSSTRRSTASWMMIRPAPSRPTISPPSRICRSSSPASLVARAFHGLRHYTTIGHGWLTNRKRGWREVRTLVIAILCGAVALPIGSESAKRADIEHHFRNRPPLFEKNIGVYALDVPDAGCRI
jgi:hypothetical protein